ncbi:MAG: hypothetical protein GY855_08000 [candidate division Zixibacteria bacterium]|nr:hypothetical protein [candidate division Zixibacteria bacterium]
MLKNFFKSDEIRVALVAGFCIIGLAVLFKRILHIEVDSVLTNSPGYFFILYILSKGAKKPEKTGGWKLWSSIIIVFTIIAVLVNVM